MKTLTTVAAFVAFALSASAASITWGFGGDVLITEDGSSGKLATDYEPSSGFAIPTSGYLALVYLGNGVSDWDLSSVSGNVVDTLEYSVGTDGWWTPDSKITKVSEADGYSDGASFAIVWNNGKTFDYVYAADLNSDGTGTVGSAVKDVITVANIVTGSEFANAIGTNDSGAVHAAVPEPATAALALLGLGMLLKRRRA